MHDIINPAGSQATTGANQNILATGRLMYYNVSDNRKTKGNTIMIIRRIRPDEAYKSAMVSSIAFNVSLDIEAKKGEELNNEVIGAFLDDNETLAAKITPVPAESYYCGSVFPAVGIGGVSTLPQYRRSGCIRAIFDEIFRLVPERGWVTSYLYPFSHTYYRQFGYERMTMRRTMKVPINDLSVAERNTDGELYTGSDSQLQTITEIYNEFASRFNAMYRRTASDHYRDLYSPDPFKSRKSTYIWKGRAYATVNIDEGELKVGELAYTDPEALRGIIGFLRIFEGQVGAIRFRDLPEISEVDCIFRHYSNYDYGIGNWGMGRILQVKPLLEANSYPNRSGHFSLKVNDTLEWNRGIFDVEYADGKAEVSLRKDGRFDIEAEIPALTLIMMGSDAYTPETAAYLPGITQTGDTTDFFEAFPKRKLHVFDRF